MAQRWEQLSGDDRIPKTFLKGESLWRQTRDGTAPGSGRVRRSASSVRRRRPAQWTSVSPPSLATVWGRGGRRGTEPGDELGPCAAQ